MGGTLQLGTGFAGYRLDAVIGRGGMAEVFLAQDPRLKRNVALKVLSPELADEEEFRARFARESELAASIDHPNIVPIYEAGEFEGRLYIAMRYVEGQDLGTILEQRGRLAPVEALPILEQVGKALDAAHARGLVHRDVKPANILVVGDVSSSVSPHCYLCDFGLTKRTGALTDPTLTGHIMGTLDYISPEQIRGEPIDGRADVYALGCVIFQALTGEVPFAKDEDVAVIYGHLNESPPRATVADPELPEALDAVVATALAKDRDLRYPTCGALLGATRSALSSVVGEPAPGVIVLPDSAPKRARRRRSPLLVAVLITLLLGLGLGYLLMRAPSPTPQSEDPFTVYANDDYEIFVIDTVTRTLQRVTTNNWIDARPSWGKNGRIAFESTRYGQAEIFTMNPDGTNVVRVTAHNAFDGGPAWSPNGTLIAFASDRGDTGDTAIYLMDANGDGTHRLTDGVGHDGSPAWSPDGSVIAFSSERGGDADIWLIDADGSDLRQLTDGPGDDGRAIWSPDGDLIAFTRSSQGNDHIWLVGADGSDPHQISDTSTGGANPTWSPNGSTIAFIGIRHGTRHLYTMKPDGRGQRRLLVEEGDTRDPAWAPDGIHIVYTQDVGHPTPAPAS